MRKPRRIIRPILRYELAFLDGTMATNVVTITKGDFERMWKLAKEAMHTREAHELPQAEE